MLTHLFRQATRRESPRRGSRVFGLSFQHWRSTSLRPTSLMPFTRRSALGHGVVDLLAQEAGVVGVAQTLEARRATEAELDDVGQVPISLSKKLAGLLATRGKSSSMQVGDSTPGHWWTRSTRSLAQGLAMA